MRWTLLLIFLTFSCTRLVHRDPGSIHEKGRTCFSLLNTLFKSNSSFLSEQGTFIRHHLQGMKLYRSLRQNSFSPELKNLSPLHKKATLLNVSEMEGITRGANIPYATHPIKLSTLSLQLLGNKTEEAQKTLYYVMIHDILEEGKGLSPVTFKQLDETLDSQTDLNRAAVILVEPDLSSLKTSDSVRESMIEVIGYERQISAYASETSDRALINASLIDKVFNLFDRYYFGLGKEEDFLFKMQWRLAKQGYLLRKMEILGHPKIVELAKSYHEAMRKRLGASLDNINEKIAQFEALDGEYGHQIDEIIQENLSHYPF